jgi:hypothetical protein
MVAAHPLHLPASSPAAVALNKLRNGEPLTDEEARLVEATMPKLTAEDLTTDTDVDTEEELAYLRGEGPDPWHG